MQKVISIFLYLLRLALRPKIWSVLEKVPWAAEKNACFAVAEWNTLDVCQVHSIYGVIQF
jgi:hypothetical protein